jgi:hypothetical protein
MLRGCVEMDLHTVSVDRKRGNYTILRYRGNATTACSDVLQMKRWTPLRSGDDVSDGREL